MIYTAFLPKYKYIRPGIKRDNILGLVFHYLMAPGATPESYCRRLNSLIENKSTRYESYHYCVGETANIYQYIPDDEKAYHCGAYKYQDGITDRLNEDPNMTTIGIGLCHRSESGRFEKTTVHYASVLGAYLCREYDLNPLTEVYTHNMITGKVCPKWWVLHPEEFLSFRIAIKEIMCRPTWFTR